MASESTPRINATHLSAFTNETVRILGKVTALRGETASIDARGNVEVILNRDAHLTLHNAAEIVGKVQQDGSVRVYQAMDFGPDIDFKAVDAVVDATHRYREIFYDKGE